MLEVNDLLTVDITEARPHSLYKRGYRRADITHGLSRNSYCTYRIL